jgi:hypothetical protein
MFMMGSFSCNFAVRNHCPTFCHSISGVMFMAYEGFESGLKQSEMVNRCHLHMESTIDGIEGVKKQRFLLQLNSLPAL